MVNENLKAILENKKPVELVQELEKYEIKKSPLSPAARGKVINKSGSGYVSENKEGYGPCSGCSNTDTFKLEIILRNFGGGSKSMIVYNVNRAREEAAKIIRETGHWEDEFWNTGTFSQEKRRRLANRINDAIDEHINYGKKINRVVDGDEEENSGEYDKNNDPSGCSVIM